MGCNPVSERGVIQNVKRAQQINDFHGVRFGNITPTDIDGLIEYHNKAWIIFEIKYKDAQLPYGQRLALERMVKDFTTAGKKAMALVVEHFIDDTSEQVDAAECFVREVFHSDNLTWQPPKYKIKLAAMTAAFFNYIETALTA